MLSSVVSFYTSFIVKEVEYFIFKSHPCFLLCELCVHVFFLFSRGISILVIDFQELLP